MVEVDPVTGVLKRDAADAKLNPYDLYAVEEALSLAGETGGRVTALSMGPPQARAALLETIYMGADQAVLISDRSFAGSDVLATAYTLSQAVRTLDYDLIICGKQTTDGDTAQVGAELAEFLDIPHAANVLSIQTGAADGSLGIKSGVPQNVLSIRTGAADGSHGIKNGAYQNVLSIRTGATDGPREVGIDAPMDVAPGGLIITAAQENRILTQYIPLPCLLCVDGGVNTPRLPSYKRKRALTDDPVKVISISDLADSDERHYGLSGSPTQVEHIFTPEANTNRETITGDSDQIAEKLAAILSGYL